MRIPKDDGHWAPARYLGLPQPHFDRSVKRVSNTETLAYHRIALIALALLGYMGMTAVRHESGILLRGVAIAAIIGSLYCVIMFMIRGDVAATVGVLGIVVLLQLLATLVPRRMARRSPRV